MWSCPDHVEGLTGLRARLTPPGLRHSVATAALSARVPIEVVAARLGDTPHMVQEVYQHVIPADDQADSQLVGDLYPRSIQPCQVDSESIQPIQPVSQFSRVNSASHSVN